MQNSIQKSNSSNKPQFFTLSADVYNIYRSVPPHTSCPMGLCQICPWLSQLQSEFQQGLEENNGSLYKSYFSPLFFHNHHPQFSSVQSLSHVRFFATPWTAACQLSLSITKSWSLLKLMSIELVMPSNHLILLVLGMGGGAGFRMCSRGKVNRSD